MHVISPSFHEVGDRLAWLCAVERLEALEPDLARAARALRPAFELNMPLADVDIATFEWWKSRLCQLSDSYASTIVKFIHLLGSDFSYEGFGRDLDEVRTRGRFASIEELAQLTGSWMPMTRSVSTPSGLQATEIFSMNALAGARLELIDTPDTPDLGHGTETVRLAYFIATPGGLMRKGGLAGIANLPISLTAQNGVRFDPWEFTAIPGGTSLRKSDRQEIERAIMERIHAAGLDHMKRYLRETGPAGQTRRDRAALCRLNGYDILDPDVVTLRFGELNEILMHTGLRGDSPLSAFNGLMSILAWEDRKAGQEATSVPDAA